jgi:dTMP kinase
MAGLFATFEGVDGAGKTTQIALLREALEREGLRVFTTREPGGDAVAEGVRHLIFQCAMTARAELLLFLAARAENVEQIIRPHLAAGDIVLCDRFTDSSLAYQGHARHLGRDLVAQLNAFATQGLVPDLTVLLDLPPEIGLARQQARNRMEAESLEFHRRVREGFLIEAENDPSRFLVLDATLPVETLHKSIVARFQHVGQHRQAVNGSDASADVESSL